MPSGTVETGAAWLSSARVVCWVRDPATSATLSLVASGWAGNSKETASDIKLEEGGDDVKSSWPHPRRGYTRATMAHTKRPRERQADLIKVRRSPGLESTLDSMKSGIASNRGSECHGEYVSQTRPTHTAITPRRGIGCKEGSLTFGRRLPLCSS